MTEFACEECGDTYTSIKAALLCEDVDLAEARTARQPPQRRNPNIIRAID